MYVDIFAHIAQIAPGFIGVAAAKFMDYDCRPAPVSESLSKYFLYAGASWLLATLLSELAVIAGITMSSTAFTALSMFIALLLGILWHGVIFKALVKLHNKANEKLGSNQGFMASCLLEEIVNDNRSHFIVAHKNDKIIASGWLVKTITHERSFYLESSPEWEEHIRKQVEKRKIKRQTIIFADSDYYFEEYTFDPKDY